MRSKNIQKILYVVAVMIVMIIMSKITNSLVEKYMEVFKPVGIFYTYFVFYVLFGVILGSHNIIKSVKGDGKYKVDYVILGLCLILLVGINGYIVGPYQILFSFYRLLYNNFSFVPTLGNVTIGYLLTLMVVRESE